MGSRVLINGTWYKAGAEDFLIKPVTKEKLLSAIERAVARHQATREQRDRLKAQRALVATLIRGNAKCSSLSFEELSNATTREAAALSSVVSSETMHLGLMPFGLMHSKTIARRSSIQDDRINEG
jgi:FixJ family two-component response regulator